jgi:hypothetical protein
MFTKNAFVVLGIVIVFCSCGGRGKNENILAEVLTDELENATSKIDLGSRDLYNTIEFDMRTSRLRERAIIYNTKAELVKYETESICNFLDSVKEDKKINWSEINKRLAKSEQSFMNVSEDTKLEFYNEIKKISVIVDTIFQKNKKDDFLDNLNSFSAEAILAKVKNNIKNIEYSFLRYFESMHSTCCVGKINYVGVIVGQNTTHLRNGEVLEVYAGIGYFVDTAKPKITIDNKKVEPVNSMGTLKKRVSGKLGKNSVFVKVEYLDEDKKKQIRTETVEYTIDP